MYLRRIEIGDFRAFPPDFSFDMTPGPGVTLLVGQNGLGKSSFIEAVEWCLTGSVRRLADLTDGRSRNVDFLRRRSADGRQADEYFVNLYYQSESTVDFRRHVRAGSTSTSTSTMAPLSAEVISALKADSWMEPVTDLSTYLRLTHFLSQSVDQRFAARGSDERWQALAAPAGSERLNLARERLGGRGLSLALNERIDSLAASILTATNIEAEWKALLLRRNSLRELAASGGAKSPSELAPILLSLERQLFEVPPGRTEFSQLAGISLQTRFRQLAESIDTARRNADDERRRISSAEELPQKWVGATGNQSKAIALEQVAAQRLATAEELHRLLAVKELSARELLASARRRASEARSALSALRSREVAFDELKVIRENQARSEAPLAAMVQNCTKARAAVGDASQRVAERRRLEQEWVTAAARLAAIEEASMAVQRLHHATSEQSLLAVEVGQLKARGSALANQVLAAQEAIEANERAVNDANASAQSLQSRASAVQSAVSLIAAHIDDQDDRCPVCSTKFGIGELKRLINVSVTAIDETVVAADSVARQARVSLQLAIDYLANLELQVKEVTTTEAHKAKRLAEAEAIRSATVSHPALAAVSESDYDAYISQEGVAARRAFHAIDERRRKEPKLATLEADVSRLRVDLQSIEEIVNQLVQQRSASASRITELEGTIGSEAINTAADSRSILLSDAAIKDAECQAVVADLSRQLEEIEQSFAGAMEGRVSAAADSASAAKAVESAKASVETLRQQWRRSGLDGDPSNATVALRIDVVNRQLAIVARVASEHRQAVDALSAWERAEELRQIEKRITDTCSASGGIEDDHTRRLNTAVGEAESGRSSAIAARNYRSDLVERLKSEANKYTTAVLRPLNELNASFLRMFSCFSDYTVSLDARTRSANVQLELVLRWLSSGGQKEFPNSVRQ